MCLSLTKNSRKDTADLIKAYRKTKHPITVYKVFKLHNKQLYSPYRDTLFNFGLNQSNRRKNMTSLLRRRITKDESLYGIIEIGFHALLNKDDAELVRNTMQDEERLFYSEPDLVHKKTYVIVPCIIYPKDVVAIGDWAFYKWSKNGTYPIFFKKSKKVNSNGTYGANLKLKAIVSTQLTIPNNPFQ